jgi:hypothetical protein
VSVNGRQIRLTGTFDDKGKVGTGAVVGAVLASPLLVAPFMGFFVTGTSAKLPMGTPLKGFVNEEVALAISAADQVPLAVSAIAAPAATTAVAATGVQQQ